MSHTTQALHTPADAAEAQTPVAPDQGHAPAREARGFVLYVGLDELKAVTDGTSLASLVQALKRTVAEVAPSAETHAALALAPREAGGRDVDVVRLALQDPSAVEAYRKANGIDQDEPEAPSGVVIDISRQRVDVDGESAGLTYKEFELLQYLVRRVGCTVARDELIRKLWAADDATAPNSRTIDVHVRRLRAKLGGFGEIVRTVRGEGYRFDSHADVTVRHASTPSPDLI